MFVFSYVTPEGDELYYYDRELQVPASVKSSLKMSFKVVDGVKFIDKLDTHITQLGAIKIRSTLTDIISSNYRTFLNEYIATNNIGYYSLCSNLSTVEANIKKRMNEMFADYGVELSEIIIKKLAIPKEIQYKLEDQAFQIRKKRAEIEADSEFSKKSLESYAAKLAIQEKFPNYRENPALDEDVRRWIGLLQQRKFKQYHYRVIRVRECKQFLKRWGIFRTLNRLRRHLTER
jgi:hypothetical protein